MTRDEIRLVVFILAALTAGALVQRFRPHKPPPPPEPERQGWAKPPYVLKGAGGAP